MKCLKFLKDSRLFKDRSDNFLNGVYIEKKYRGWWDRKNRGFSLVEMLVVIAIIGVLATVIFVSLGSARYKARDAKRKTELAQIGRLLSAGSCYMPNGGTGVLQASSAGWNGSNKYYQVSN